LLVAFGSSVIGVATLIANANVPFPADLKIAKPWPVPAWIWFMLALLIVAYAQFRMWADEYHGRATDKASAESSAEVQRLAVEAKRIEMESKERDWRTEREILLEEVRKLRATNASKPSIALDYGQVAQFGGFVLCNTGDIDATNIQVSNLVHNRKFLRFRTVSRLNRGGASVDLDVATYWVPNVKDDHDGRFHSLSPLSPDKARHRRALEWLIEENSPELEADSIYHGDVTVAFDDADGNQCEPRRFQISFNLISKRIEVFLMRPEKSSEPSVQQSPESSTHEN